MTLESLHKRLERLETDAFREETLLGNVAHARTLRREAHEVRMLAHVIRRGGEWC